MSEYNFDNFPIGAFRRVPFAPDSTDFEGMIWPSTGTGSAVWEMQIRERPGKEGSPLVTLTNAAADLQGLYATVSEQDGVSTTHLFIRIDEVTMEALPQPFPVGADVTLYYDIHVTPAGDDKRVALAGPFIVKPGVTI